MTRGVNDMDITLFLVGTDEDDAQQNMLFDAEESAVSFAADNPGTKVFSVSATVDFTTIEPLEVTVTRRSPDQIMEDFDAGCRGERDVDMRAVLWEVIDDIRGSYRLAIENLAPPLDPDRVDEVVLDYVTNHYGDD